MSKLNRRSFGTAVESLAAALLVQKGYEIIRRSYHYGHKEIDLICRRPGLIVFVEVKAARSTAFGAPEGKVTLAKQRNIVAAAQKFIQEQALCDCDFRFDVITAVKSPRGMELTHWEGAFDATMSL